MPRLPLTVRLVRSLGNSVRHGIGPTVVTVTAIGVTALGLLGASQGACHVAGAEPLPAERARVLRKRRCGTTTPPTATAPGP